MLHRQGPAFSIFFAFPKKKTEPVGFLGRWIEGCHSYPPRRWEVEADHFVAAAQKAQVGKLYS